MSLAWQTLSSFPVVKVLVVGAAVAMKAEYDDVEAVVEAIADDDMEAELESTDDDVEAIVEETAEGDVEAGYDNVEAVVEAE